MGVLGCDRNGCSNIMCDRYSEEHGYICNECYRELCEKPQDISVFMESGKLKGSYAMEDHMRRVKRVFELSL